MQKSLDEIHSSIPINQKSFWRKIFSFAGPAFLVSVGYMDPGNWATDLAGGSLFGYQLLWVLVLSNITALLLQSLSARLGLVLGIDLAQGSQSLYPKYINYLLWIFAEIAIAATDLAEILGLAIGLFLLFKLPILYGVILSVLDSFLLLFLLKLGLRKMEAFIIGMISIITGGFLINIFLAKPKFFDVISGVIPQIPNQEALYIAIGIIGATVMPHNLYLHSALVQSRRFEHTKKSILKALKYNFIESAVALNIAFCVNASILILAGAVFYTQNLRITEIIKAHELLTPLLGTSLASILFAIALIASGQSSTITGTLAGQVVMEGYLNLRLRPWLRRLLTRSIAICPALLTILISGDSNIDALLIGSQVLLSMQLGFAVIPLIHLVSNRKTMGQFVIKNWVKICAWLSAFIIIGLNLKYLFNFGLLYYEKHQNISTGFLLGFGLLCLILLLLYVIVIPILKKQNAIIMPQHQMQQLEIKIKKMEYKHIAIPIDFSIKDNLAINTALSFGSPNTKFTIIHIVESAAAWTLGNESQDLESQTDKILLENYTTIINSFGFTVDFELGFGQTATSIATIVAHINADLVVMAGHGHRGFLDILLGETLDSVRHLIKVPLYIAK